MLGVDVTETGPCWCPLLVKWCLVHFLVSQKLFPSAPTFRTGERKVIKCCISPCFLFVSIVWFLPLFFLFVLWQVTDGGSYSHQALWLTEWLTVKSSHECQRTNKAFRARPLACPSRRHGAPDWAQLVPTGSSWVLFSSALLAAVLEKQVQKSRKASWWKSSKFHHCTRNKRLNGARWSPLTSLSGSWQRRCVM